jgi:hypothetical protein
MTYRKETGHNNGFTRIIRVITIVLFALWSCLMLGAQINGVAFIQHKESGYVMDMMCCFTLLGGYAICFVPITASWIAEGFRQDKYL